jgi:hypothetical protein
MNILKRFFVIALSVVVMFNVVILAYASEDLSGKDIPTCTELGDNSFLIQDESGNNIQKITVEESESERKTTIENILDGKIEYIVLNKKSGEIYSSITGKTITREEQTPNTSFRSEKSYGTVYVSYSEIRSAAGITASVGAVLGFILTKVPNASVGSNIADAISRILGLISNIIPNDSNHGLVFTVKTVKYYRTRLGRRQVWRMTKSITAVKRY